MWTKYQVEWKFITKLCGSVPADPELQKKWLESRKPKVQPANSKSMEEMAEEVRISTEEVELPDETRGFYCFQRLEGGLVLRAATVRAHIKDCARILSSLWVGRMEREKSFAVKVINSVYYPPELYWIPILSQGDGQPLDKPTATYDKAIHVRTQQGERSALKTMEYVEGAMLRFPLMVLTQSSGKPVISETDLGHVMEYGGTHGYGGERGDGEGRYAYTVVRVADEK